MIPPEALEEIRRLNANLETLHRDAEDFKGMGRDLREVSSVLKETKERLKSVRALAKQIHILNQIMLKIKKSEGMIAMFERLVSSLVGARR